MSVLPLSRLSLCPLNTTGFIRGFDGHPADGMSSQMAYHHQGFASIMIVLNMALLAQNNCFIRLKFVPSGKVTTLELYTAFKGEEEGTWTFKRKDATNITKLQFKPTKLPKRVHKAALGEYRVQFADNVDRSFFVMPENPILNASKVILNPLNGGNMVRIPSSPEFTSCIKLNLYQEIDSNISSNRLDCFRTTEQEQKKYDACAIQKYNESSKIITVNITQPTELALETFTLKCTFKDGFVEGSVSHSFQVAFSTFNRTMWLIVAVGIFSLFAFVILWKCALSSRAQLQKKPQTLTPLSEFPKLITQASITTILSDDDENDNLLNESMPEVTFFKPADVEYCQQMGEGNFGQVFSGKVKIKGNRWPVAIKRSISQDAASQQEVLHEAHMLTDLQHDNVVELMGVCCCSKDNQEPSCQSHTEHSHALLFLRYTSGSLKEYMTHAKHIEILDNQKYLWAYQISSGMEYLISRGIVHFDLAARNILLQDPDKDAAIADFGLSRFLSEEQGNFANIPFRSHAPEVLLPPHVVTPGTDIWSYGVLLWEIFTHGRDPYADRVLVHEARTEDIVALETVNFETLSHSLLSGYRLQSPFVPSNHPVYTVMNHTWNLEPSLRPAFSALAAYFQEVAPDPKFFSRRVEERNNYTRQRRPKEKDNKKEFMKRNESVENRMYMGANEEQKGTYLVMI